MDNPFASLVEIIDEGIPVDIDNIVKLNKVLEFNGNLISKCILVLQEKVRNRGFDIVGIER